MAKKASFEVRFRGENEQRLLPWKPTARTFFECSQDEAERRFDEIVGRGLNAIEVDGVIPYVVEVAQIDYVEKKGDERKIVTSRYWRYCEDDAVLMGDWASMKVA